MEEGREYLKNFEKNDVPGQSVTGNPQYPFCFRSRRENS